MKDVRTRFPNDADVVTIHSEAVMNLSPWDYWTADGKARPGISDVLTDLEGVMAAHPDQPGACHYYIHAVEATHPEKAVPCAERLAALMPGAGHLVHMPAHIYIRVGRWSDAITSNEHAVHTDETFIKDQSPTGAYPIAYYPHNYHFLAFASSMAGKSEQAIAAARAVSEKVTADMARAVPPVEGLIPHLALTLVRFGKFSEVLSAPLPPSDLRMATALTQYARGVALAATHDTAGARAAHDTVSAVLAATTDPLGHTILDVAHHALLGEMASRNGDLAGGERHFRQAMTLEDGLQYMEPPHWYYPIRHSLGALLLEQKKAAEAERLFRQDLAKFPENIWSLKGLRESLSAQGKSAEAAAVDARIAKLGADPSITASRY
jgi:predicted Zn-dependent protease